MRGPATLTDEMTAPEGTEYLRREGYLVVRTPACPTYHCGNGLILDEAPDDPERFVERFLEEHPGIAQIHIEWETTSIDGTEGTVNHLGPIPSLERRAPVEVRPLAAADWPAQLELAHAVVEERFPGSRPYSEWRNEGHRVACEKGRGRWWGAFEDGRLVGSAGLYETPEWARFQNVTTATGAQGRGVCTTLMHHMASEVLERREGKEVILVATAGSQAERIYHSVGFVPIGTQYELSRPRGGER